MCACAHFYTLMAHASLCVQIGMFCYTGMTPEMVDKLANLSIYLTRYVIVFVYQ